jgi:hypothetical protein
MNWGVIFTKKSVFFFVAQMGNTHSGKPRKSLEKPGFLGIPGKFSSLHIKIWNILCLNNSLRTDGNFCHKGQLGHTT